MTKLTFALASSFALMACSASASEEDAQENVAGADDSVVTIDVAITNAALAAAEGRSDEDKVRDENRKPAEVLAFLGMKVGDTVLDLVASGGWYSVAAGIATGPAGKVYAQNPEAALKLRDGAYGKEIVTRLAANNLPQIERLDAEITALPMADGSVDLAITALNFHDVYDGFGPEAAAGMLQAIKVKLKPGGVLGIIDHVGDPGADNKELHRIDPALVVASAEAAGYKVERNDDLLTRMGDDRSKNVFDPAVRGKTDRFILKLTKPE